MEKSNTMKRFLADKIPGKEISWKSTIGFDFVFVEEIDITTGNKTKKAYCVELNGSNSGIGLERVKKGQVDYLERLFARIRGSYDMNSILKFREGLEIFLEAGQINGISISEEEIDHVGFGFSRENYLEVRTFILDKRRRVSIPIHAYDNPKVVRDWLDDKSTHYRFIPEANYPDSNFVQTFESKKGGAWIIKPNISSQGKNILIIGDDTKTPEQYKRFIDFLHQKISEGNTVQRFLESCGAEMSVGTEIEGDPQCMRLLIDFTVFKDGTFTIENGNALQRVDKDLVVNTCRGAKSFSATENEKILAMKVVQETIINLVKVYDGLEKK
jgi:hypothetical protein